MGKLFRAIAMVHADAPSMNTHRVGVQPGKSFARSFRPKRRWIWEITSGVVILGLVGFVSVHWPASNELASQQSVFASIDQSKFLLRLSGSDTIGPVLAPELVRAWFASVGATSVQETQRVGPDGNKIPEWLIRAILNGNLVEVEVKTYGSATAFRGMAKGDADIGMASPEMNSAEVAKLMNNFVRFSSSVEGHQIVTKARFALPLGEDSQLPNTPEAIALPRDGLKPVVTEQGARPNIPSAPTRLDSAPPSAAAIAPEVATEQIKTPPGTAVVPKAANELTKRPPPVLAVIPEPVLRPLPPVAVIGLEATRELTNPPATIVAVVPEVETKALPPVAAVVPEAAGDLIKAPRPTIVTSIIESVSTIIASLSPPPAPPPMVKVTPDPRLPTSPVAITSHRVAMTDYPLLSIRLQEQGTVTIQYLVKEDGSVGDCIVTVPSGRPLLDDAACAMVKRRWKFEPATRDGKPVAEFLAAEVAFTLK